MRKTYATMFQLPSARWHAWPFSVSLRPSLSVIVSLNERQLWPLDADCGAEVGDMEPPLPERGLRQRHTRPTGPRIVLLMQS